MARKKDPPKPLLDLRQDFVAALENLCQECVIIIQAIEFMLTRDVPGIEIPEAVRETLTERVKALRDALMSDDY